jgi:ABC-type transport system involved in multi-copper enzyme maturation permease subunit
MSSTRIKAILRKELREYQRSRAIIVTMAVIPIVFTVQPLIEVFNLPAASAATLLHKTPLLYMLAIPALVPAVVSASSVVAERQQGTLEPILTTPVTREELIFGKALAALVPACVIAYVVFGIAILAIELFAQSAVASAVVHGPELLAQVIFTPLLATWSIWVAMAISSRSSDIRVAQQLGTLASLPAVLLSALFAFGVIHASLKVALAFGIALFVLDRLGWRVVCRLFDRERLISATRS